MKRLLCAAGVALALALSGAGVASASVPSDANAIIKCGDFEHQVGNKCVPNVHPIPGHSGRDGFPGHGQIGVHHRFGDLHRGVVWGGPVILGTQVWINEDLDLDVCDSDTYVAFVSRHGQYRGVFDHLFGNRPDVRFVQLHQACAAPAATVVIPAGLSLVRGHYLDLSALHVAGLVGDVDVCAYGDWNAFDRFADGRFHGHWGSARGRWGHDPVGVWRSLRARASCAVNSSAIVVAPQQSTTIVSQAAPSTTVESAPASTAPAASDTSSTPATSLPSGTQVSQVPSGHIETGYVA